MANNTICHVEWPSTDFARTKEFYGTLFGWKFTHWGIDENYVMYECEGSQIGGGFWKVDKVEASQGPVVYIIVDDLEAYVARATQLGGTGSEIHEIPGIGWSTTIKDPDGNTVGLFKGA